MYNWARLLEASKRPAWGLLESGLYGFIFRDFYLLALQCTEGSVFGEGAQFSLCRTRKKLSSLLYRVVSEGLGKSWECQILPPVSHLPWQPLHRVLESFRQLHWNQGRVSLCLLHCTTLFLRNTRPALASKPCTEQNSLMLQGVWIDSPSAQQVLESAFPTLCAFSSKRNSKFCVRAMNYVVLSRLHIFAFISFIFLLCSQLSGTELTNKLKFSGVMQKSSSSLPASRFFLITLVLIRLKI